MEVMRLKSQPFAESEHLSRPQRLRKVCEDLGTSFIKLGQILSGRPEWLPPAFIEELEKLQDNVATIDPETVKATIEEALGGSLEEHFESFDARPLAAASIGQVHAAVTHEGSEVVVKVQRPRLKKRIEIDLEIMHYLASVLEQHVKMAKRLEAVRLVQMFKQSLERELDFRWERRNLELFQQVFKDHPHLHVPKVYSELCHPKVLVLERVRGLRPEPAQALRDAGFNTALLAKRGASIIMEQIFVHGFYHADPHPGNIFVLDNHRLCYVDYGMVGRIGQRECEDLASLAHCVVNHNERRATQMILRLTEVRGQFDRPSFERQLRELMDHHLHMPLKSISLNLLLSQLIQILREHHLVIKPHFFLMLKALGSVENVGRKLDPDFQMVDHLKPFLKKVAIRRYHPTALQNILWEWSEDLSLLGRDLPRELKLLAEKASSGHLSIGFEHRGLQALMATLDRVSNRLSFAIMVSSLIIGSSLILHARIPPLWKGVPLIGLGGFSLAAAFLTLLLLSMLRNRRW